MNFLDLLLGRPIPTSAEHNEKIGPISGVPIFGLDALGSAAYGPEAALTLLLPLGAAGIHYIVPVSTAIIIILGVVFFFFLQSIADYLTCGGLFIYADDII